MIKDRIDEKATKVFAAKIRLNIIKMIVEAGGNGHMGGSLSTADIIAVLYNDVMTVDPLQPHWDGRDYLILSKGHGGPTVYAALALKGFFPMEELMTLNKPHTRLPSHCDRNSTIGIDMSTGSLGLGACNAVGLSIGLKIQKKPNYVYCITGDGEMNEGPVWEAAQVAAQYKLDNLIMICDKNGLQASGSTDDVMDMGDLRVKLRAFGWYATECDGHDVVSIFNAIKECQGQKGTPCFIQSYTVKGKGWKKWEGDSLSHNIPVVKAEDVAEPMAMLEEEIKRYS